MRINEVISQSDRDKFKQFILTNCKDALEAQPIWRGIERKDYLFKIDSQTQPLRSSANSSNYVQLFISGMESWKQFPRRQVICSTDRMYASGFGNVYRVFPVDGTAIGVCPRKDFWMLPYLEQETNENVYWLSKTIGEYGHKTISRLPNDHNLEAFLNDLRAMATAWPKKIPFLGVPVTNEMSLIERIGDLLDPAKNRLTIQTTKNLNAPRKEVWFDSKAVLVAEKETWIMGFKEFSK